MTEAIGTLPDEETLKRAQAQVASYPGLRGQLKSVDMDFLRTTCFPPIDLDSRTVGDYSIRKDLKKEGDVLTVVSHRNMLMMGYRVTEVELPCTRVIHNLIRKRQGRLMADSPQEMFLQYEAYQTAKGKVLVGGLGLGMYASMIAKKDEVTEIIVVEIEQDVIDLIQLEHSKITIVHDDLWNYIKTTDEKFDFIYVDIHYSTGAMEFISTVLPMKEILEQRFSDVPNMFWGEKEMKSQYHPEDPWVKRYEKKHSK